MENRSKPKTQNNNPNSNSSESNTLDYVSLDGPRVPCTFRCNKRLWKSFVSFSKANYGSVCHILEPILIAIMQQHVILSDTLKPLHIENLVVERAVKRVRRYANEVVDEDGVLMCHFCRQKAVGMFRYMRTMKDYPLCKFHAREFVDGEVWSVIKDE